MIYFMTYFMICFMVYSCYPVSLNNMRLTILSIIEMCLSNLQGLAGIDLMYNADMARCADSRAQEHEPENVVVEDATPFTITVADAVVVQEIEQHEAIYQVATRVSKKASPAMLRRSEPYKARVRTLELARQSVVDGLRVHHKRDMGNVCKKVSIGDRIQHDCKAPSTSRRHLRTGDQHSPAAA